jgi:hypothetical protein
VEEREQHHVATVDAEVVLRDPRTVSRDSRPVVRAVERRAQRMRCRGGVDPLDDFRSKLGLELERHDLRRRRQRRHRP